MKKKLAILLLVALFVGSALQAQDVAKPELRIWKDSTGQFSIQATFVRVNGDNVVLQGIGKNEISLPLAKLSAADQQYVKARLTPPISPEQAIAALEKIDVIKTFTFKKDDNGKLVFVYIARSPKVTDAALVNVAAFTDLPNLVIELCDITGAGLEHLKGLVKLERLSLTGISRITDADLVHLRGLANLNYLNLYADPKRSNNKITGAGLIHLKGLTKLEKLNLSANGITDAELVHLKTFTNLRELYLFETEVTDAGVAELQKALPNCKIKH